MCRLIAAALIGVALFPGLAAATQQGESVIKNWKRMDACA
jgi:hypothetical protein